MPAPRKPGSSSLLDSLNERTRAKAPDNFASIQTYYRSAAITLRQADEYRRRDNDAELYVMLTRFISLIVETIPRHRAFSRSDPKYLQLRRDVASYMDEAERVKAGLALQARLERLGPVGGPEHDYTVFLPTKVAGTTPLSAGNLPQIHWDASAAGAAPPPAGAALGVPQPQGFDLLAGLGLGSSGSVAPQLAAPPPQPAFPDIPELSPGIRLPPASQATLAKHALLPTASLGGHAAQAQQQRAAAATQQPRPLYPELAALEPPPPPPQQQQQAVEAALASLDVNGRPQADGLQPPLPGQQQMAAPYPTPSPYGELQLGPQEVGVTSAPYPPQPLPPHAACCAPGAGQVVPPSSSSSGVAEVKKLQRVRDVHVSVALMDEFMRYAVSNTRRGIETCGILAGSLSADDAVFTITTLIVPKQEGTSDTVEMLNEEEIFEVQDSRALYPLGWIHTHPTQTCFLSSVDVHTHCGFQTMLDEAVAVVMAPKDPVKRVGIFRLSTPGGLKLVQRCPQRGFHAHPPTDSGQPIYELCGHVFLNPRAQFEVVDLR